MGTRILPVHPSNADQARSWDGDEGDYWTTHAERFDEAVAGYHRIFLDTAAIDVAERVLDIGCGTGQTTRDAARRATGGMAVGVDLSSRMIALARRLAELETVTNARFEQADAQVHPFHESSFDAAISRTGAMFFGDPAAAFANIARALRPGGRLVLLAWQPADRNEWIGAFAAALAAGRDLPAPSPNGPGPFSMADPARVRSLLSSAGFVDPQLRGLSAPMYFGRDADDAHRFILGLLGWMMDGLDDTGRAQANDSLRATVENHTAGGVWFESAAWLITAGLP